MGNLFNDAIWQSVRLLEDNNLFEILGDYIKRRELLAFGKESHHHIHIPFGRVAGFADHEDIVHTIVSNLVPGDDVVDGQFCRILDLLAAVPAHVRRLNLSDVVLEQIVDLSSTLLVCLERLCTNRETRFVECLFPF